jgi:WD repeat-containing protein 70
VQETKTVAGPTLQPQPDSEEPEYDPDEPGPPPPPPQIKSQNPAGEDSEPEYDPSEPEFEGEDDLPDFPTTHEIILKDHTKVVSALALDPSGARVLSGSHDYDVKLWDFGGMDARCKPFKSWEPAGTYYVRIVVVFDRVLDILFFENGYRFTI